MRKYRNSIIKKSILVYSVIVMFISLLAMFFSYSSEKNVLLSDLNLRLVQIETEYEDIIGNFWNIYMPVYENAENEMTLRNYFNSKEELSPVEKINLKRLLHYMAARDRRVQWVAAIRNDVVSYIYYSDKDSFSEILEGFPFIGDVKNKQNQMEIYGLHEENDGDEDVKCLAIAGGVPDLSNGGAIIAGYNTGRLNSFSKGNKEFESVIFEGSRSGRVIYHSSSEPVDINSAFFLPFGREGSRLLLINHHLYMMRFSENNNDTTKFFYLIKLSEYIVKTIKLPILILIAIIIIGIAAWNLYLRNMDLVMDEVGVIQDSLKKIGQNNLEHRINYDFNHSEFSIIAASINKMAEKLDENINRARIYEQKQKEAEMKELSAKFNPHFLYNTLEIFRARCYENDDPETAELIGTTAAIFRGFIGAKTFIPINEELASTRRYLSLFKARYEGRVSVYYDIESEILSYGIIRNAFQPLIENYFEHGIDPEKNDNYIRIKGSVKDEENIEFLIEDNGIGMGIKEIAELNSRITEPINNEKESYGLKNLNQRLNLFYGDGYGIRIFPGEKKGVIISMLIKKQSCETTDE